MAKHFFQNNTSKKLKPPFFDPIRKGFVGTPGNLARVEAPLDRDELYRQAVSATVENDMTKVRAILEHAVVQFPDDIRFIRLLGDTHRLAGDLEKALLNYMSALVLEPRNSKVLTSIAQLLILLGKPHDAKDFFLTAYKVNNDDTYAAFHSLHYCMHECDWNFFPDLNKILLQGSHSPLDVPPLTLLALTDDPELHHNCVRAHGREVMKCVEETRDFDRTPVKGRKIKIGYFSNDFYDHATMHLLGRFFELQNRDKFEVQIFDFGTAKENDIRKRLSEIADRYHNVKDLNDVELAGLARDEGLDIAVDLKGHTKGSRLAAFGYRAAPVQVSFLGYPASTGLQTMDYFIADKVTVPEEMCRFFSEKLLYMPHCYQPNDRWRSELPEPPSRATLGLPEEGFVFCSLNNPNKITPQEFDVWMPLLQAVENSVLWLLAPDDHLKANLLKEADKRGIPATRLVFAEKETPANHLSRMQQADLFLDAFNYNAHTTASEAVWAGVPLITKTGKQFSARVATSILNAAGCPELVTNTVEEYQSLALHLATTPSAHQAAKQRLKDNLMKTPLYDSERYVRDFEELMEMAIQRFDAGEPPVDMALDTAK